GPGATGPAQVGERALAAAGIAWAADGGAEFHQPLVEVARSLGGYQRAAGFLQRRGCEIRVEQSRQHAARVAVDGRRRLAERDAGDGAGSVFADAGQFAERGGGAGHVALKLLADELRGAVQVAGARVVAEPGPGGEHVVLRRGGEPLEVGEPLEPAFVVRY